MREYKEISEEYYEMFGEFYPRFVGDLDDETALENMKDSLRTGKRIIPMMDELIDGVVY